MTKFTATQPKLTQLLREARLRILDVVDAQYDFMAEDGALAVHPKYGCREDASAIIEPTNRFFRDLPEGAFDLALLKFDTHFADEYARSPEAVLFPNPHCIFGTDGWRLAVDAATLIEKFPAYMLAKNEFDMWGSNPTGVNRAGIKFAAREEAAYDNLFKVIDLQPGDDPAERLASAWNGIDRDTFMKHRITRDTVVVLCGVASDFCDYQALLGYLQRGATVVVAEDLTAGIGGAGSPAPETGAMRDVVSAVLEANLHYAGRLYTAKAAQIVEACKVLRLEAGPVAGLVPGKPVQRERKTAGLRR